MDRGEWIVHVLKMQLHQDCRKAFIKSGFQLVEEMCEDLEQPGIEWLRRKGE